VECLFVCFNASRRDAYPIHFLDPLPDCIVSTECYMSIYFQPATRFLLSLDQNHRGQGSHKVTRRPFQLPVHLVTISPHNLPDNLSGQSLTHEGLWNVRTYCQLSERSTVWGQTSIVESRRDITIWPYKFAVICTLSLVKTRNISGLSDESVQISANLLGHMVYLSAIQQ
jgi:hypothetical protein